MKKYVVLSLLVLLVSGAVAAQQAMNLSELPEGAFALITFDSHDSWVTWAPDDMALAFISAMSGLPNLYVMDLEGLQIIESELPGLYVARYLVDETIEFPFYPLTMEDDMIIDSPSWSPSGTHILVRTYKCDFRLGGCFDHTISLVDVATGIMQTVLEDSVSLSVLGDSGIVYYVDPDESDAVQGYSLDTKTQTPVFRAGDPIKGLVRHGTDVLVATNTEIQRVDPASQTVVSAVAISMVATQVGMTDDLIIYTMRADYGPAVGIQHIDTGESVVLLESYDYEPVLSNDARFVAFLSEGIGGIIIHRLRSDIASYPQDPWGD